MRISTLPTTRGERLQLRRLRHAALTGRRATPEALQWWRKARFGMFFHFSLTACRGVELDWGYSRPRPNDVHALIQPDGKMPQRLSRREYEQLHQEFNPHDFDAQAWIEAAAGAGAGYVILSAKNHDGFCFWDTRQTDYKTTSSDSPFGRDVVAEIAEACRRSGLRLGLYYSQRDWHHRGYLHGDKQAYQTYVDAQLRELLSDYGTIDVLWFDAYGLHDLFDDWNPSDTMRMVRGLQPDILINSRRSIPTRPGSGATAFWNDVDTVEQHITLHQTERPWESRIALEGNQWGYRPGPPLYTLRDCVHALVRTATGDGNLLLGIRSNARGLIEDRQRAPLAELGRWLSRYGSTILGTRSYPVPQASWGGATQTTDAVYVHITDRQAGPILIPAFEAWNGPAEVLTGGTVQTIQQEGSVLIEVSNTGQDPVDTIVKLSR
jgi:alpha-L-fucosidase